MPVLRLASLFHFLAGLLVGGLSMLFASSRTNTAVQDIVVKGAEPKKQILELMSRLSQDESAFLRGRFCPDTGSGVSQVQDAHPQQQVIELMQKLSPDGLASVKQRFFHDSGSGREQRHADAEEQTQQPKELPLPGYSASPVSTPDQIATAKAEIQLDDMHGDFQGYFEKGRKDGKRLLVQKWSTYMPTYERYLSKFRGRSKLTILELGVRYGGSLNMWLDYFGPGARAFGIDIEPSCARFSGPRKTILIGDVNDKEFLQKVCRQIGPGTIDFINDDASHWVAHQRNAFDALYPCLNPDGGIYMVEDIDTSYKKAYSGLSAKSFVSYAFDRVNDLNAYWSCESVTSMTEDEQCGCDAGALRNPPASRCTVTGEQPWYKPAAFTRSTMGMYFHDGIIVFDKRKGHDKPPKSIFGYA